MLIAGAWRDAVRRDAAEGEDYWPASIARSLISSSPVGPWPEDRISLQSRKGSSDPLLERDRGQDHRLDRPRRRNGARASCRPRSDPRRARRFRHASRRSASTYGVIQERDAEAAQFEQGAGEGIGRAHADDALAVRGPPCWRPRAGRRFGGDRSEPKLWFVSSCRKTRTIAPRQAACPALRRRTARRPSATFVTLTQGDAAMASSKSQRCEAYAHNAALRANAWGSEVRPDPVMPRDNVLKIGR